MPYKSSPYKCKCRFCLALLTIAETGVRNCEIQRSSRKLVAHTFLIGQQRPASVRKGCAAFSPRASGADL